MLRGLPDYFPPGTSTYTVILLNLVIISTMVLFKPGLLPVALSLSMILQYPGSELMSGVPVITMGHVNDWVWSVILDK
ncbi:hypothetical protein STEG23_014880, partial [Scotinomys teguina]